MFDSIGVRVALFFYVVFAGIALFLLWRNSAASDALKNAGILVASILPVVIAVLPYLNQEKIEKHFNFILFYDAKDKIITSGKPFNPYFLSYGNMFTNLSLVPGALGATDSSEQIEAKGLNIIEKGVVEALHWKFFTHWDIERRKFEGPLGTSETWESRSKLDAKFFETSKIREIFKHNPLIAKPGVLVGEGIYLPPKSKINVKTTDLYQTIIITNPYVTLKIACRAPFGMVAQQGIWGVLTPDPAFPNRYMTLEYQVDATLSINRTKAYSPEMKYYKKWFENVSDALSAYDWNVVDRKIEHGLNREAISKVLGKDS